MLGHFRYVRVILFAFSKYQTLLRIVQILCIHSLYFTYKSFRNFGMLKMLRQDVIRQKTVLLSLLIIVLLIKIGWYIPVLFASVYIDNLNKITSYSVSFNPAIGLQIKMWSITMDEDLIKANCSHLILFLFNLIFYIV